MQVIVLYIAGSFAESPAVRQRRKRREREEDRKKERETPLRPSLQEELKWYLGNEGWLERIGSLGGLLCLQVGILSAGFSYLSYGLQKQKWRAERFPLWLTDFTTKLKKKRIDGNWERNNSPVLGRASESQL